MTTLPPFVELMASLGLDSKPTTPSCSPSPSNSPRPRNTDPVSPIRSKSSPSLRDLSISQRGRARYSPYSSISYTRRGSTSSVSSCSSEDKSPSNFSRSSLQSRRFGGALSVNTYGSTTDLSANMPISTYVRRKTPGGSPTSPTFPRDYREDSLSPPPVVFTVPALPTLLPSSIGTDSVPATPESSELCHMETKGTHSSKAQPQLLLYTSAFRHPTGIHISTPPRVMESNESHIPHHSLAT